MKTHVVVLTQIMGWSSLTHAGAFQNVATVSEYRDIS